MLDTLPDGIPIGRMAATPAGALRVGILEDEPAQAYLLTEILRSLGYDAMPIFDQRETIRMCGNGELDMVLTDLNLPGLTGFQVARRIKAIAPDVSTVLVTGWPVDRAPEISSGEIDAVLQKPYQMSEVLEIIERVRPRRTPTAASPDVTERLAQLAAAKNPSGF